MTTHVCEICGEEFILGEGGEIFDGKHLCMRCLNRETTVCEHCGGRVWNDDAVHGSFCANCFDEYYTTCTGCGAVISREYAYYLERDEEYHDNPYCRRCYESFNETIHDYYFKPDPIFYGTGKLFMGVEIELDEGGEDDDNAETLLDIANFNNDHLYAKHDGSLDNGIELVSHPMTLEYHKNNMPWKDVLRKAIYLDYRSHQAMTCGLHVHINKSAFGNTTPEQEEVIAKLIFFYEKFWAEILRFSRRTETQANRWASRYGGAISTCKNSLDNAKKAGLGRYTAVNLMNENTVEFRIFRGTLRYTTFMATLEFVDCLCQMAMKFNDEVFQKMSWSDFVSDIDTEKYPELVDYLKSRRLYVNEPTEETEEI